MRIRVDCIREDNQPLPFDYQYELASLLYNRIQVADEELAEEMHSETGYKFYTFSWLKFEEVDVEGGLVFDDAWFYVSSPDNVLVESLAEGLLEEPILRLNDQTMEVKGVEGLREFEPGEKALFKTLSPIYLKTLKEVDGDLTEWDLYPGQQKWKENLRNNLISRYEKFNGESVDSEDFQVKRLGNIKRKRMDIAGSHRRCALVSFEAEGDPKLLKFGYDAGFGEKTAMGFGCVGVIE